ncbi:Calcium-binding mitochondrial carrier protein SCaMC-1 (Small calcium-binding mitochondrial carrier protein 1) (Solute carrier family 25 member 24) [Durusdinium trenchii]|uniref:Calcium-binding mitochondrial carrier protein SCaMC-1 (Small calcium-binding mitochondrial carrier protein 1) (Solute carrier family 25 member 24) n=1 Tax=Durusdinium trenchii TaxID=1381693 RepID=A0ABP0IDV3_9DINO
MERGAVERPALPPVCTEPKGKTRLSAEPKAYGQLSGEARTKLEQALRLLSDAQADEASEHSSTLVSPMDTDEASSVQQLRAQRMRSKTPEVDHTESFTWTPAEEAKLKECFEEISRHGIMNLDDYRRVMQKLQVPLDEDQVERVFTFADRNKDGRLTFEDYVKLVALGM